MRIDRRHFIGRVAAASGVGLFDSHRAFSSLDAQLAFQEQSSPVRDESLPLPNASGIQHIVVVTMENRSCDHLLGWLPNANAKQDLTFPTLSGGTQNTLHWPDYQGCGHPGPD